MDFSNRRRDFNPRQAKSAEHALAIELLCAVQALEFLKPLMLGRILLNVYERVRTIVPPSVEDYAPSTRIEALVPLVRELGSFLER